MFVFCTVEPDKDIKNICTLFMVLLLGDYYLLGGNKLYVRFAYNYILICLLLSKQL